MALTNKPKRATFAKTLSGHSIPVLHGVEIASATWTAGAFLQDDDSGALTLPTSPINASAVGNRAFGMALNKATGVTAADAAFIWLTPDVVLEMTLSDPAGTHTLAQADQWKVYPVTVDGTFSTGFWYLNGNAAVDTGGAVVVGFKDPIGTVDGRVYAVLTNPTRGGVNAGSATY